MHGGFYPACTAHSQCSANYFCATECHTGGCGGAGVVERGTKRNYCQPCEQCQSDSDSITTCSICNFAGTLSHRIVLKFVSHFPLVLQPELTLISRYAVLKLMFDYILFV